MKKDIIVIFSVVFFIGCQSVAKNVEVSFNVRSRDKIPAKKIKLLNEKDAKLFENKLMVFSSVHTTIFKKCRLFFVCEPRSFNPFYIAVPNGSEVALMLKGWDMAFVNEIIKNEQFSIAEMKDAQIKELLKHVFDFNKYGIMYIIKSKDDLNYNLKVEKDIKRKVEAEKLLAKAIKPMSVVKKDNKAVITFFFVEDQDIIKRIVMMNQDGTIDSKNIKDEVVGKDLAPWHRGF